MGDQSSLADSQQEFDPYHMWLGIAPKDQPPHHYRLLGIELFEENADVIDTAANRHTTYLHDVANGPHRTESQRLLSEIAVARRCLLDSDAKSTYDEKLKAELAALEPESEAVEEEVDDFDAELEAALDGVQEQRANGLPHRMAPIAQAALPGHRRSQPKKQQPVPKEIPWPFYATVGGGGLAILLLGALVVWLTVFSNPVDTSLVGNSNPEPNAGVNSAPGEARTTPARPPTPTPGGQPGPGGAIAATPPPPMVAAVPAQPASPTNPAPPPKVTTPPPKGTTDTTSPKPSPTKSDDPKPTTSSNGSDDPPEPPPPELEPDPETIGFVPLSPIDPTSSSRSTKLVVRSTDGSVLVANDFDNRNKQTYTVKVVTDIEAITAFQLLALPDKSLVKSRFGPGLGRDGMFSLAEFKVLAAPASNPDESAPLVFNKVVADIDQDSVATLIDGDPATSWTINDRPDEKRLVTFLLKEPLTRDEPTLLTFQLEQEVGLGRFQLLASAMKDRDQLARIPPPELPLFVNVGGGQVEFERAVWLKSRQFEAGPYGYDLDDGGRARGSDRVKWASSCAEGIKSFRVNVPNGSYTVALLFSDFWVRQPGLRVFSVQIEGQLFEDSENIDVVGRVGFRQPLGLKADDVVVEDGVLDVEFIGTPQTKPPILNAIAVNKKEEPADDEATDEKK